MSGIHLDLAETTIDGPGTRHRSLHRDDCPELAVHRILHLGMTDAAARRIEKAQHLLTATADKVESIAQQVGFADASVFSRDFKRRFGQSPKAHRE